MTLISVGILLLFSFVSMLVDLEYLPRPLFRHVGNFSLLLVGLYLFLRIKAKAARGTFEAMQQEYQTLQARVEAKRSDAILNQINDLKERIAALEGKI